MSLDLVTLALAKKYTDEKAGGGDSGYTLPIGGENLGGVKNGGNVVINEDGTMDAPVSDSSQNGNDGFSPIATVTQTEDGATITITDKTGTTTATVTNGEDGQPGTTPHIGDNGNWWIGETDTGVSAGGGWKKLIDYTTEEQTWTPEIQQIAFTHDDDGNPLSATRIYIKITGVITGGEGGRLSINGVNFWDWKISKADEKFCISMFCEFSDGVCSLYSSAPNSNIYMTWRYQTVGKSSIEGIRVFGGNYNAIHLQAGAHIEIWGM